MNTMIAETQEIAMEECEACGITAVCSLITLQDGDLLADILLCPSCRFALVLRQMTRLQGQRVSQLRGEYND